MTQNNKTKEIPKRKDKHAPMEVSSKRPVTRRRQVVEPLRKDIRDPRFDPLCGHYNPSLFDRSYGFLKDYQVSEVETLKGEAKKTKSAEEKEKLEKAVESMTSRIKTRESKEKQEAIRRDWKKQELKRVSEGKKPYYLKEGDYKRLELVQRYEEIKERGGSVEKFLEKRRKKNAAREHRMMPYERRSAAKE